MRHVTLHCYDAATDQMMEVEPTRAEQDELQAITETYVEHMRRLQRERQQRDMERRLRKYCTN